MHIHQGGSLGHQEEWNYAHFRKMDGPGGDHVKWIRQTQKDKYPCFPTDMAGWEKGRGSQEWLLEIGKEIDRRDDRKKTRGHKFEEVLYTCMKISEWSPSFLQLTHPNKIQEIADDTDFL
jgi:hypothetical protein